MNNNELRGRMLENCFFVVGTPVAEGECEADGFSFVTSLSKVKVHKR